MPKKRVEVHIAEDDAEALRKILAEPFSRPDLPGEVCQAYLPHGGPKGKIEKRVARACERAYRRGFQQGLYMLYAALEEHPQGREIALDALREAWNVAGDMRWQIDRKMPWFGDRVMRRVFYTKRTKFPRK